MTIRSLTLGLLAGATLAFGAHAADTNAEGAAALTKALTGWLPEKIAASQFLTAVPEGDHYKIDLDFAKLVNGLAPPDAGVVVSGSQSMKIYPPEGAEGLMAVKGEPQALDIRAKWDKAPEKGSLAYLVKDFEWSGQFDPAIRLFRSGMGHASGGTVTMDDGKQKLEASFGPLDFTQSSTANPDKTTDLASGGTIAGFKETITGPDTPPVTFTVDKLKADATIKGVKVNEIKELIGFVMDHAKEKDLKVEDKKALALLARKALPLLSSIDENVVMDNIIIAAPGVGVKVQNVTYGFGMNGLTDNSNFRLAFGFTNPEVTGIPQVLAYGDLIPKDFRMNIEIPNLNFASAANAFFDQADFDKPEPLTKEQSDAIGKLFLKDGRVDVDVPELSARSNLYDISVSGKFSSFVEEKPVKATAEFDVTARNIDGTIKGIQELAQRVPDLNTASFGLMMAKGMAKTDPDGTSHWKVEVSDDGVVKINGQQLPH